MKLFDPSITPEEQQMTWYVDRETVLDDLAKRLKWEPNTVSKVVVNHGPGGIGKTSVRKMTESRLLKPAHVPYVIVDYEPDGSPRSAERTFGYIRRQLGRFGLRFPAFDLVWARHWEETTQQRVSRTRFPSEIEDAADIIAIIPVLGSVPNAAVAFAKLSQSAAQWMSQRFGKGGVARLKEMNAMELVQTMPEAMARDLEEMIGDKRHRGRSGDSRITVIFDGFERLAEHDVDDWFVHKFWQATGSTLKVIFGRETLKWERHHPEWPEFLDHYPALSNLQPDDATEYLKRRGVDDAELRRFLVELTDGFPYHLRLATELCESIEETTGREPDKTEFSSAEHSTKLGESLLNSLLRQIDKDEHDAAMLASIPRWFTEEILEILSAEPASAPRLFQTLIRFSFCEIALDIPGAYILRKEARKILRDRARRLGHWVSWNRQIQDYHAQHRTEFLHLVEEIYHGFIVDPATTLKLFHAQFYQALNAWRFGDCRILIQASPHEVELPTNIAQRLILARVALLQEAWESEEGLNTAKALIDSLLDQELSPDVYGRAIRLVALADIKLGDRNKALDELQKAVAAFDSLNDLAMKACALREMGDLYYQIGDLRHALESHEQAITTLRQFETTLPADQLGEAQLEAGARVGGLPLGDSLRAVASLYARTGRTHMAAKPLEQMLEEGRKAGNIRTQAEALSELGLVYRRLGRLQEAEAAYRQDLPLMEEIGATPGQAHVLSGLGMTLEQGGDVEAARPYFQQSLRLFEEIGDTYGQAKLWHCLARVDHKVRNYDLALEFYMRSLEFYREIEYLANTGALLLDLAILKITLGQTSEALNLCEEARGVFEGLEDQAAIAGTYTDLGIVHYLQGQSALAVTHWKRSLAAYDEVIRSGGALLSDSPSDPQEVEPTDIEHLWVDWMSMYDPVAQIRTRARLSARISLLDNA